MNKEAKKDNGIKDSISKLFILRDSCQGTCVIQKDNPNIFWFEGATVLLQQGVDNLKSVMPKMESGDKEAAKAVSSKVKETLSKLTVLQRSAVVTRSEDLAENAIWFEGAEYIIAEVVSQLQKTLQKTEAQAAIQAAPESSKKEDTESEGKTKASEADDAGEEKKQAAAG